MDQWGHGEIHRDHSGVRANHKDHSNQLSRSMGLGGISSAWHWPAQVSTHEATLHHSIAMLPRISSQSTDAGHLLTPQHMSCM